MQERCPRAPSLPGKLSRDKTADIVNVCPATIATDDRRRVTASSIARIRPQRGPPKKNGACAFRGRPLARRCEKMASAIDRGFLKRPVEKVRLFHLPGMPGRARTIPRRVRRPRARFLRSLARFVRFPTACAFSNFPPPGKVNSQKEKERKEGTDNRATFAAVVIRAARRVMITRKRVGPRRTRFLDDLLRLFRGFTSPEKTRLYRARAMVPLSSVRVFVGVR